MISRRVFLSIVTVSLIMAGFFVAVVPFSSNLAPISGLFLFVVALPSYVAAGHWLGRWRSGGIIVALSLFALVVESLAIRTGLPYGHFTYSGKIGGQLFGLAPWTVPFASVPLVAEALALTLLYRLVWSVAPADTPSPTDLQISLFLTLVFWTQIDFVRGVYLPALLGLSLCLGIGRGLFTVRQRPIFQIESAT